MTAPDITRPVLPDYALPDHADTIRTLSEIQRDDPMIVILSRGHYCPKEHQQHLELAAHQSKFTVAYTQIVTISTDVHHTLQEFRDSVGAQWPFLSDPGRTIQQDLDIQEYTDPEHDPMIPHTLVLKPGAGHPSHLQRLLVLGPAVVLRACGAIFARSSSRAARLGPGRSPDFARRGQQATTIRAMAAGTTGRRRRSPPRQQPRGFRLKEASGCARRARRQAHRPQESRLVTGRARHRGDTDPQRVLTRASTGRPPPWGSPGPGDGNDHAVRQ